jgi:hypothetical protein
MAGNWEFVGAAYGIAYGVLAVYCWSLYARRRQARAAAERTQTSGG